MKGIRQNALDGLGKCMGDIRGRHNRQYGVRVLKTGCQIVAADIYADKDIKLGFPLATLQPAAFSEQKEATRMRGQSLVTYT